MTASTDPDPPTATPTYALLRAFCDELARCGVREVVIAPGSRSTPLAMSFYELERGDPGRLRLHHPLLQNSGIHSLATAVVMFELKGLLTGLISHQPGGCGRSDGAVRIVQRNRLANARQALRRFLGHRLLVGCCSCLLCRLVGGSRIRDSGISSQRPPAQHPRDYFAERSATISRKLLP